MNIAAVPLHARHQMIVHGADAPEAAGVLVRHDPVGARRAPLGQNADEIVETPSDIVMHDAEADAGA